MKAWPEGKVFKMNNRNQHNIIRKCITYNDAWMIFVLLYIWDCRVNFLEALVTRQQNKVAVHLGFATAEGRHGCGAQYLRACVLSEIPWPLLWFVRLMILYLLFTM